MSDDPQEKLLDLNRQLLVSIADGDWETYSRLCDEELTAFEPEARGQLVSGMSFHRFYFDRGGMKDPHHTTLAAPQVRILGDVAIVTYVRLIQHEDEKNNPVTSSFEETRIWQLQDGQWRNVHFHRSRYE